MGALAPVSAHARPSAETPIDTSGNFSAQVSGRGVKSIDFLAISGDSKHFSFFSEKTDPPGASPQIFVNPKSYFFVS